jgi:hypothetical protein
MSLQQGLAQEFKTSAINVNIENSTSLTILFQNSDTAQLPPDRQAAFARRVAEFVRDHYAHYERLESIQVGFASVKGGFGVRVTSTRVPFRFTPAELGAPRRLKDGAVRKVA